MIEKMKKTMSSPLLQQSESHSMYIKPFMSEPRASPQRTFCFQPLGIAKPVETVKRTGSTLIHPTTGTPKEKSVEKSYDYGKDNTSGQLSSLHVKLYTEAERIRKWKIATEMDIEQKEQKLKESAQLMESQRKSLLELQLENENLSLHLSEEIENKQDVMQKVSATRELCFAAKGHMDILEKRICSCEETRIMIDDINAKRMTEVEVLLRKFEELSNKHEEKMNILNNAVKVEKAEKESLKSNFLSQLNSSAEELRKLHDAFKIKEVHNSQLQQERDNCNTKMSIVLQKLDEVEQQLKENQLICSEKEKEVFALCQNISEIQNEKCKVHICLEKSEEEVKELECVKSQLTEKIAALNLKSVEASNEFQNKLSMLECLLEKESIRKKELELILTEKEKEIEEFKRRHDSVTEKLNESAHQCDDMQKLMEELGTRKLYLEELIQTQQESLRDLQLVNDELTAKGLLLKNAQKQIEKQEEEISDMKKEHAIKIISLDGSLKEKQYEIDNLQSLNTDIKEELKYNLSKIEDLGKEVKTLNKKLKIKAKINNQSKEKLQTSLEITTKENETMIAKIASLQEQLEKTRNEWETEKENMKNLHKFEMKEILNLLDKTEENYQNMTLTKETEIQELKSKVANLSNELETEQNELEKMQKDWEKEKSSMKELHSSEMKDVFDILKKAEESYQKTILAKESEAEELRSKITNYSSYHRIEENKEAEINRLKYENDNLKDMMEAVKKSNEMETSKLKSDNDKLHIELDALKESKEMADRLCEEKYHLKAELDKLGKDNEMADRLCEEKYHLKAELDKLRKDNEKTTMMKAEQENKEMVFDNLLQDNPATMITRSTVKRSSLATAEVRPKPRQDYKSYSRNLSSIIMTEKSNMKRQLMPITEVRPLVQQNPPLDPQPKQRKFFKSSRITKRHIKDSGLLWFELEEEE